MPRIRTVKPEFWTDTKLARLSALDRLVFLCLIGMADDEGRIEGDAETVWHFGFPRQSIEEVAAALRTLVAAARVVAYSAKDGTPLMALPNFTKHQRIDKPTRSRIEPPPDAASENPPRALLEPSARTPVGIGWDGKGEERKGGEAPPASPSASNPADPVATLAADLAHRTGDAADDCAKAIRELVAEGIPLDSIRGRVESMSDPIGVWTWKRTVLTGWKSQHAPKPKDPPGANPPVHDAVAQAARRAEQVERAKQQAEFDASGYRSRTAWQADRQAGNLRKGDAAARRCFTPGRGAHDAPAPSPVAEEVLALK